jgi:hypothetical protein
MVDSSGEAPAHLLDGEQDGPGAGPGREATRALVRLEDTRQGAASFMLPHVGQSKAGRPRLDRRDGWGRLRNGHLSI